MTEEQDALRYAKYLGDIARACYGTPQYADAKRQWMAAVDAHARLARKAADRLAIQRASAEGQNAWRGR